MSGPRPLGKPLQVSESRGDLKWELHKVTLSRESETFHSIQVIWMRTARTGNRRQGQRRGPFKGRPGDVGRGRGPGQQMVANQPAQRMFIRIWPLFYRRHGPRSARVPRGQKGSTLMTRVSRSCVASPDWHPGQGWSQGEGRLFLFSWTQCLLSQPFFSNENETLSPNTGPLVTGSLYPRSPQL